MVLGVVGGDLNVDAVPAQLVGKPHMPQAAIQPQATLAIQAQKSVGIEVGDDRLLDDTL